MKTRLLFVFALCVAMSFPAKIYAQFQILWEDPQDILSVSAETQLFTQLAEDEITVVMNIEYSKRCDYYYVEITKSMNQAALNIMDCNRKSLGSRTWTARFFSLESSEQVNRIAVAIAEILENPQSVSSPKTTTAPQPESKFNNGLFTVPFNHHTSRYFFSPSSFNLQRGELYYSTLYFGSHDLQYGITDNFSVGMGTTLMLMPFYITPKYAFNLDEKNRFSLGTMIVLGTWGIDLIGNLGYATYTYGSQFNNVTLGLGHLYLESEDNAPLNKFVINAAAMARMSDHIYFVTENYFVPIAHERSADYYGTPQNQWGWWDSAPLFSERFTQNGNYFAGMMGFRFINKNHNVNAFQFGLTYIFRSLESSPAKYTDGKWYYEKADDWRRFVIPTISFVSKLGKRV
jgi:hypothetical protein